MASQCMVAAHHRAVYLVHRAKYSGMLLQMATCRGEFVLLHQLLLCPEHLFYPGQQPRIGRTHFMITANSELSCKLSQALMRFVELSDIGKHDEATTSNSATASAGHTSIRDTCLLP